MKKSSFAATMIVRTLIFLVSMALFSCNSLPKPKFTWFPEDQLESGDSIWFFDESKRSDAILWEFGDGGISNATNPVYIYKHAGIFEVSLNAVNDAGENLAIEPITINEATVLGFAVFDSTLSHSLPEATVWVYDNESDRDHLNPPLYEGLTDSVGKVEFRNVEPIPYHIWVAKEEAKGAWTYRGYTHSLKQYKVNYYTVACTW